MEKFLSKLTGWIKPIAKKYPALARMIEISFYGAIGAVTTYGIECFTAGELVSLEKAASVFAVVFGSAFLSGIQKSMRDKMKELGVEKELE